MNEQIKPLHNIVIVERIEPESKTSGGIIIPDSAKEKSSEATVLAVGPGSIDSNGKLVPTTVKVGDKVLFPKYNGTETKVDGKNVIVLRETEIFAIIN